MKTVNFLFGIHNHQPIGNFDFIFDRAFLHAYKPFIDVLKEHPKIRICLHFSGILIDWIETHYPDYIDLIGTLCERGQIEMMTGGYYEPILPVIPRRDALGQIEMLSKKVHTLWGQKPQGLWLTERVWEPHLPELLHEAGIKYLVVDDNHFNAAGLYDDELYHYFISEENGKEVRIFPILKKMRENVPFKQPEESIEFLRSVATEEGNRIVVLADDGEKFGDWPETYEWIYERKYLHRLFTALEENSDWITIKTGSELIEEQSPAQRIYLPACSYTEMTLWALPAKMQEEMDAARKDILETRGEGHLAWMQRFMKGGFWRIFFSKYDEANAMHKKMLLVHDRVWGCTHEAVRLKALDELWKGQVNCPYWHGVFGGLYLNHIRHAVYQHLIEADKLIDSETHRGKQGWLTVSTKDYDNDGYDETLFNNHHFGLIISPRSGGNIIEWDLKNFSTNLLDTLNRRKEFYHADILRKDENSNSQKKSKVKSIHDVMGLKESGLSRLLVYDTFPRKALIDHFFPLDATFEDLNICRTDCGTFSQATAVIRKLQHTVELQCDAVIADFKTTIPVHITKTIHLSDSVTIECTIRNDSNVPLHYLYGMEFNFALLAGDAPDHFFEFIDEGGNTVPLSAPRFNSKGVVNIVSAVRAHCQCAGMELVMQMQGAPSVWRYPLETVSQSESGYERVYQSSLLCPVWELQVPPTEQWKTVLRFEFNRI